MILALALVLAAPQLKPPPPPAEYVFRWTDYWTTPRAYPGLRETKLVGYGYGVYVLTPDDRHVAVNEGDTVKPQRDGRAKVYSPDGRLR